MDKIGDAILKNQNESIHIDELIAQKRAYSIAKNYQGLLIFLTVPLPIIISICVNYFPNLIDQSSYIFVLYLIVATLVEKILEKKIDRLKKMAASIQEEFDTNVLNIRKGETINSVVVDRETVRRYSKDLKQDRDMLKSVTNWYSLNLKGVKTNVASLLCQRTNITYDFSVREKYKRLVISFSVITFSLLFIISLFNNLTLKAFVVEVILPSIPIFLFSYKEVNSNTESIDNLKHLRNLIESTLQDLNIDSSLDHQLLRKIQNRIYNNRVLSPLIPDFIYKMVRPKLEDEMNYSVATKLEQLRNS